MCELLSDAVTLAGIIVVMLMVSFFWWLVGRAAVWIVFILAWAFWSRR